MKKIIVYGDYIYNIDCDSYIIDSSDNTLDFFDGNCVLKKRNNDNFMFFYKFERLHIEYFHSYIVENDNNE